MKKSRLPFIIFIMTISLALSATCVGVVSYFLIGTGTETPVFDNATLSTNQATSTDSNNSNMGTVVDPQNDTNNNNRRRHDDDDGERGERGEHGGYFGWGDDDD